ncbi:MAG: hypothetical protein NVSMB60_07970 [Mycobacterium sp.]
MLTMSAQTTEYVHVSVSAVFAGVTINPTTDVVSMAFTVPGTGPVSADWKAASWLVDTSVTPNVYYARALIGPSGGVITLTAAVWDVWLRITDNPEAPVRRAAQPVNIF